MKINVCTYEDLKPLMKRIKELEAKLESLSSSDQYMSIASIKKKFDLKDSSTIHKWVEAGLLSKHYPDGDETKHPRFKREEVDRIYKQKKQRFFT